MRNLIILLVVFFASGINSGCKKYPEDDVFIQWKSPEKRLVKYGPWVFDKLTVDGVDRSVEFRTDSAYFERIEFKMHEGYEIDFEVTRSNNFDEIGLYELSQN